MIDYLGKLETNFQHISNIYQDFILQTINQTIFSPWHLFSLKYKNKALLIIKYFEQNSLNGAWLFKFKEKK